MNDASKPVVLVPNPNAFQVRVGAFVTQRASGRRTRVAKKDEFGCVWEAMETDHPSLLRNGGSLPDDHLRYVGADYVEFEPAFIAPERLQALTAPVEEPLRLAALLREHRCGNTRCGCDIALMDASTGDDAEPLAIFTGPRALVVVKAILAAVNGAEAMLHTVPRS